MWYVLQVRGGHEQTVLKKMIRMIDSSTYKKCFIPKREVMKRRSGEWVHSFEVLFPGYIFVDTTTIGLFRQEVKRCYMNVRVLSGTDEEGERTFVPVSDQERNLILSLMDEDGFVMRRSEGFIVGDEITVVSGPLKGHVGLIKKIDRHKRTAFLETEMFGRTITIKAALEIVSKR